LNCHSSLFNENSFNVKREIVEFRKKMDLAQVFTDFRKNSGKSQREFAEMLGIPQTTWSGYERGQTRPKMDVLLALAEKGYEIKGLTSNFMESWSEDQKKEYQRRMKILQTGAFPPEMPMDDFVRILKAVDDHPPHNRDTSGLIPELEKVMKNSQPMKTIESRLLAIEERLKITPQTGAEYPAESGDKDSYTQDPEPEYGEVTYGDNVAAGPPIGQSEDQSLVVDVPLRHIKTEPGDYYVIRVQGNSMIDARILDGSLALIKKTDVPRHDAIQVVRVDGRATLKLLKENEDHRWTLCYEDGTGRTIPLGDDNRVQGDFVAVLPLDTRPRMRGE
jgi:SOS-response transcriptional repressor LexA/transcriptional regulator with XRE-family HTH domain